MTARAPATGADELLSTVEYLLRHVFAHGIFDAGSIAMLRDAAALARTERDAVAQIGAALVTLHSQPTSPYEAAR